MRLLLDTHIILWMFGYPTALSARTRTLLEDSENELFFSPISLFEIAVKSTRQRHDFAADPQALHDLLLLRDVTELPLVSTQVMQIMTMPSVHKDPFDRLLLAQAIRERLTLLTVDSALLQYPSNVMDAR